MRAFIALAALPLLAGCATFGIAQATIQTTLYALADEYCDAAPDGFRRGVLTTPEGHRAIVECRPDEDPRLLAVQ